MEKLSCLSVLAAMISVCMLMSCRQDDLISTELNSISVKTPPSNIEYIVGEVVDLSGLVVELSWDNGISEDVAFSDFGNKGIICDPVNGTVLALSSDEVVIAHITNNSTSQNILVFGSVTDIENNTYKTIQIGNQIWIAENLKTRYYANGDAISDGTSVGDISGATDPKYWFSYNDDLNNVSTYGRLYTWYTLNDNRNVCPSGWHVPTNTEWSELVDHLGGEFVAGGKLKENGTLHWLSPNEGATNESGFTAIPGGTRGYGGFYGNIGYGGNWWSSTENTIYEGYSWGLSFNNERIYYGGSDKKVGFSCRCVKN